MSPIIQARPTQVSIRYVKTQGPHKPKLCSHGYTGSAYGSCVVMNLRLMQDHMKDRFVHVLLGPQVRRNQSKVSLVYLSLLLRFFVPHSASIRPPRNIRRGMPIFREHSVAIAVAIAHFAFCRAKIGPTLDLR